MRTPRKSGISLSFQQIAPILFNKFTSRDFLITVGRIKPVVIKSKRCILMQKQPVSAFSGSSHRQPR